MKLKGYKKKDIYVQQDFVEGKRTCPICRKTNEWDCNFTENGSLIYCKNVKNDSGETDSLGKYKHTLKANDERKKIVVKQVLQNDVVETVKADASHLDRVYSAFLENLELKDRHIENLEERGFDTEQIHLNMYASVPGYEGTEIVYNLSKTFDLEGVPGFYFNDNHWRLNIAFSGFYIPYRDEKSRIVGLQIRRDENVKDKYMWVSSDGKSKGTSSGSPLHFVNVDLIKERKEVYVTEGALKADIIANLLDVGVIASAGINAINPNRIFEVFPEINKIILVFDMDWQTKEKVRLAYLRLLNILRERNVNIEVAVWDLTLGKGFDDVLVNKNYTKDSVKYISADEFYLMLTSIESEKANSFEGEIESTAMAVNVVNNDLVLSETEEESEQQFFNSNSKTEKKIEADNSKIIYSWNEFSEIKLQDTEKVIFGLVRGNTGLLVASTNLGKSTLSLNLALSATGKRDFNPLLNSDCSAKRVLYIDGEATKAELQTDIAKMLESFTPEQVKSVGENLFLICDAELDDEPLDLVNESHFNLIRDKALACKPDLIIVDTLSALMDIEDENDNAIVKREAMKPLRKLARLTNSAVLLLHHTGKYNEGFSSPTEAYKGRGASAFGALSRTVLTLEKSNAITNGVKLSCPKVKGKKFVDTILELDTNSRWFKFVTNDKPEKVSNYEKVIEFVINFGRPVKRQEIVEFFENEMSYQTVDRHLSKSVKYERLRLFEYGVYSAPTNIESELPIAE